MKQFEHNLHKSLFLVLRKVWTYQRGNRTL